MQKIGISPIPREGERKTEIVTKNLEEGERIENKWKVRYLFSYCRSLFSMNRGMEGRVQEVNVSLEFE
jgi:hypothetical protein